MKLKNRFLGHDISARSAQMTYYWILALFPFLIMVMSILSYTNVAESEFMTYLNHVMPSTVMPLIEDTIIQIQTYRSATILSFGVIAGVWSASTGVNVIIKGIHRAYSVTDTRPFWIRRLISIMYTLVLIVVIVGMIVLLVFGNKIGVYVLDRVLGNHSLYKPLWDIARFSISILVLLIGLYMVYKVVPRKHRKTNTVWPGTLFASVGWYTFSILFAAYIDGFSKYNQMYGSIGSVFVLLIWLYTSGVVLLVGAEINALLQDFYIMRERKRRMR